MVCSGPLLVVHTTNIVITQAFLLPYYRYWHAALRLYVANVPISTVWHLNPCTSNSIITYTTALNQSMHWKQWPILPGSQIGIHVLGTHSHMQCHEHHNAWPHFVVFLPLLMSSSCIAVTLTWQTFLKEDITQLGSRFYLRMDKNWMMNI